MYYYNHNDSDNNQHAKDNDDPFFSHSLDSMVRAQTQQQDWQHDDTLASYLSAGLQSHSLDSPFFSDAFGGAQDWDVFGNEDSSSKQDDLFMTLPEQDQQAILLSDPTFVRQQQLLQEQQKQMELRMQEQEDDDIPVRSNLSAMFEAPAEQAQPRQKKPTTTATKKENRRSASNKRTTPIPISSNEIDHQRRLNELQARFRVNYARKPNPRKQQQPQTSVMSSSFEPSSLPNFSSHPNPAGLERRRSASIAIDPPQQATMRIGRPARPAPKPTPARVPPTSAAPITSTTTTTTTQANTTTAPFPSRTMPIQIHRVQRPNQQLPFDKEERQRKLDQQLEKVDFGDITVSELKEMLRQRGRPATGKKAVLVQRLLDERDMIKALKTGRAQRHSLPPPSVDIPPLDQHASSVPSTSGFPAPPPGPGSPGSTLGRSIANMHIGSPPVPSRRFAPYSPTRGTGSPKQQMYSSSMPTSYLTPMDDTPRTPRYPRHMYAPRNPSALATPDHEEEQNPFDQYIMMHQQQQQEQAQAQAQQQAQQQAQIQQQQQQQHQQQPDLRTMDMEWDPAIDMNFPQQGGVDISRLTQEELLQLFTTDMPLDTTFLR
ncbi:hypothetical protein BJV82DRAFT_269658 [Fennellomyces sp. T-0311]|nr:hypothetical protein BJV82DRAFT_269658 [Fennellomyces sp. T-0311]